VRLLTPTENKRLNELIGFLGITLAVLIALALFSYSPRDASFNVSASSPDEHPARNWIGPVGAHGADLLFQGLGFAAFLLPVGLSILGWRWFRSQPVPSPIGKLIGYGLLLLTVPSLLAFLPFINVRGLPAGGLLGTLLSTWLRAAFNLYGAVLVTLALFLTALFLTTRFSFSGAHAWLRTPVGSVGAAERLGLIQRGPRTGALAEALGSHQSDRPASGLSARRRRQGTA
jgi:DNA segregation ATPase FtsK/SpoIIIE, S-DNA-T family